MRALNVKLWRDLLRLRAQVFTIALVVACGVAGFVGEFSTHDSLKRSRDAYYREARFADLFASVRRAPLALRERIAALPGVARVKLEVAYDVPLDLPDVAQPVTARLVGLASGQAPSLNALTLRSGRLPQAGTVLEAVVTERFAQVRSLAPGSRVQALINGRRQWLSIVGTVLSPEYVYATRGGAPDDRWFGAMWIDADRMSTAYDMRGAFNRVSIGLEPGASSAALREALDRLLEPYGATDVVDRSRQLSSAIVDNELRELEVLGTVLPAIFLLVAVFILNGVMSRQVATQRQQIATLKAVGYSDAAIAWHYLQLALLIALVGVVIGLAFSVWLGRALVGLYADVFRFAALEYRMVPAVAGAALLLVAGGAAAGALSAISSVVRLAPAQAMQAPAPLVFRRTWLERILGATGRHAAALMVLRNLVRRPWRATFTVLGIAAAVALQISGAFWGDMIAYLVDTQFRVVQQGDAVIEFTRPMPMSVVSELRRLPGVVQAEAWRSEPVRVRLRGRSVDTVLSGHIGHPELMRVVDINRGAVPPPPEGVRINALLARELRAEPGDVLELEFRLWHRRSVAVPVADVVETLFGRQAYMELGAMNRLAGDGEGVNAAAVTLDAAATDAFYAALKGAPAIAAVTDKAGTVRSFNETTARNLGFFTAVLTAFAVAMATGIVYNAAGIALSERAWELASLRVLGMTRAEVSVLLLAELGVELLLALPLGCLAGWGLANGLMALMRSENIDFPAVIAPATYGTAMLCILVPGALSALIVRRRIDRLDLVEVLKVRE
ncbi:MAG: ABC transporter permease [Burkholderiaceae bacterium]|nr:ABC transporter permease [Burkholderiaceae bacterium]